MLSVAQWHCCTLRWFQEHGKGACSCSTCKSSTSFKLSLVGGFSPTPLKNDGVRQLGWWHSQLNGKISKPPTSSFCQYAAFQGLVPWYSINKKDLPEHPGKLMGKNSRTNWDTVLKANKVLKFLIMFEKSINIYTDSIDITCVLFKSLNAFGPWNLNMIETETKCLFQSIDWRENLRLPSSTIIYLYLRLKIWFPSNFPLNKYNDWKHRRLWRKTQDQSRSAALGLLGSLPENKKRTDMWPCGCCMAKKWFIITWSPLEWWSISLLLAMRSPPK